MRFVTIQDVAIDSSDVASVSLDDRVVTVYSKSGAKDHRLKFSYADMAEAQMELFVNALNSQSETNNEQERHRQIMSKLSELATQLAEVEKNQDEANTEIVTKLGELTAEVESLKAQLGDTELPAEAQATLERVLTKSKGLADIIQPPAE